MVGIESTSYSHWLAAFAAQSLHHPIKRITLTANGAETATPLACSVDIGRAIYQAEAHKGVGGTGTAACSGDLLLGALAACAQLTCQLVATAMGVPTWHIEVTVSGNMDLQGTRGISKEVPVGFEAIRAQFNLDAPGATPEQTTGVAGEDGAILRRYANYVAAAKD